MTNKFQLHNNIFREYDIRGIYGKELQNEIGFYIGYNLSYFVLEKQIYIAKDGRISSEILTDNLIQGFKYAGFKIYDLGLVTSPMAYYATKHSEIKSLVMVTGSHNPAEENGFKFIINDEQFYGKFIQNLRKKIGKNLDKKLYYDLSAKSDYKFQPINKFYINYLKEKIAEFPIKKFIIAWDPGNGASCEILKEILKFLPGSHILINDIIDGSFPNRPPDPMIEKNLTQLCHTIKEKKCDFGIAFDGDGDRINILDENGNIVKTDIIILLFAQFLHKYNNSLKVMADAKSSEILFQYFKFLNIENFMCRTGHSLIKNQMKKMEIDLAGEISGHIFFKDNYYFDDAIYNAIRFCQLLSNFQINLSKIVDSLPKINASNEIRIYCKNNNKFTVIQKLKRKLKKEGKNFSEIDGVRYSDQIGWWIIRASNTEDCLTLRYEIYKEEKKILFEKDLENILLYIKKLINYPN